jgi:hypothetical protein
MKHLRFASVIVENPIARQSDLARRTLPLRNTMSWKQGRVHPQREGPEATLKDLTYRVPTRGDLQKIRDAMRVEHMRGAEAASIRADVMYRGGYLHGSRERASPWSLFTQFPALMFSFNGSAFPYCFCEVLLCTMLGGIAAWQRELLAFLTVFRSQIAWNFYKEGYTNVVALRTACLNLAHLILTPMVTGAPGKQGRSTHRLWLSCAVSTPSFNSWTR